MGELVHITGNRYGKTATHRYWQLEYELADIAGKLGFKSIDDMVICAKDLPPHLVEEIDSIIGEQCDILTSLDNVGCAKIFPFKRRSL